MTPGDSKVENGVTYIWDGTKWAQQASGGGWSTRPAATPTAATTGATITTPERSYGEVAAYDASATPQSMAEDAYNAANNIKPLDAAATPQSIQEDAYNKANNIKPLDASATPQSIQDEANRKDPGAIAPKPVTVVAPAAAPLTYNPAWDDAATRAKAQADAREAAYAGAAPRTAPQAATVNVGPAAQAGPVTVARARDVVAPNVQRATVAGVVPIEAAGVQRAFVAPTASITGTDIGRAEDRQTRGQQELSIQALQDAAAGRVPSAAENQAKLLADRAIKQSYATATALQGTNAGSALRAAEKGGAEAALNIAADAYAQRAGEQATARGQLASTLGAVRGQDIGVNTEQAKLTQEANVRNQTTDLQTKLAQGDIDQKTFSQASANLQNARVQNQQMELQRALAQGEIDKATFIARSQLLFDAAAKNQAADVTTNVAQANVNTTLATSNAAETNKVAIAQAGLDKDVNVQNAMMQIDQMKVDDTRKAELGRQAIESEKVFQNAIAGKDDSTVKAANIAAVQQQLEIAKQQLAIAKTAGERSFWQGIVSSGLSALGTLGAAFVKAAPIIAPAVL